MSELSYCQIPLILNELKIKSAYEMQILGMILTLPTGMKLSNQRLADLLHTSRQTIILCIKRLKKRGYICNNGTKQNRSLNVSSELFLMLISQNNSEQQQPLTPFEKKIAQSLEKQAKASTQSQPPEPTEKQTQTQNSDTQITDNHYQRPYSDNSKPTATTTIHHPTIHQPAIHDNGHTVTNKNSHTLTPGNNIGSHNTTPANTRIEGNVSQKLLPLTGQIFTDGYDSWLKNVKNYTLAGKRAHTHNKDNKIMKDNYYNNPQELEKDLEVVTGEFGKQLGKYDLVNAKRYLRQHGLQWCLAAIRANPDCVFLTGCFKKGPNSHDKQ